MIDIEKWKENIEAEAEEKEIRNCRRAVELYGKVDVNELTDEFLKLESDAGECIRSLAADIQEEDAISESVIEAKMLEEQNEMLYDMANAFLNIANGMCDTEDVKYSTLYNKKESEHMLSVITLIYEKISNTIQSIKILSENA